MPIKWSALKVSEAADMIEEHVNQAAEPLEQARIVAQEALKIADLPQYIQQAITGLLGEIERVTGGNHTWGDRSYYDGCIKRAIARLRDSLPSGAVEAEKKHIERGITSPLV